LLFFLHIDSFVINDNGTIATDLGMQQTKLNLYFKQLKCTTKKNRKAKKDEPSSSTAGCTVITLNLQEIGK